MSSPLSFPSAAGFGPPFGKSAPPARNQRSAAEDERPAKRTRFDFEEEITVLVGENEKRYTLYKKIICDASDPIRAACTGPWKEGQEGIVRLPEAKPDIFSVYVCWLHTNDIDVVSKEGDCQVPTPKYSTEMPAYKYRELALQLFKCSRLADELMDKTFANAVVDELIYLSSRAGFVPFPGTVNTAWSLLRQDSGFVRAIVDLVAVNASKEFFAKHTPHYPAEFIIETMQACIRDRSLALASRGIYGRERCFYHDHEEGKGKTTYCGRPAMKGQRKTAREDNEA